MSTRDPSGRGPLYVGPKGAPFQWPALPPRAKTLGCLMVLVVALPLAFAASIFDYVKPNEFGIKEVKIGMDRGVQERVYGPGYWFVKPFGMEKMHHFPRQVLVLELSLAERAPDKSLASHSYSRAAKIQTSDGFFVDVDVTILYRIVDPYKLMTTLGPGLLYLNNGILPKAEPILKQTLGELKTEDFYNSPLRVKKTEMAKTLLDAEIAPKGMKVDQVLIRYFKYSDEIQKNIEAKKLQDQLVFKNQAEAKANTEEAAIKKAMQEGEVFVKLELEGGEAYKTEKAAETELYTRRKGAEGKLLVQTAEAQATEWKNAAMQLGGYDRKVALEMVKVLEGIDPIVVPCGGDQGVNPLALDSVLDMFGVKVDSGASTGPPPALPPPLEPSGAPSAGENAPTMAETPASAVPAEGGVQ
ncbi:MAG TPA: SPFH domain-containing protein [Candidatus Hydrogenedentes bacterium]|nr:SPFH domain-containing protein [Candidatus Hydrogenedentota bacterium]HOT49917.1 SPFH domain-containing protein [Candidatus Hydrogenedentota bacterium]HOV74771.1 SPFH domain-containing protein [Candidatus Hydrogenedentota bacterium]HPC17766.1 SPFH domain-containing protein [Candidatus Hydrogenedentota bacterium]HRT21577.1 SPFH domain-containing protein [Candidatus Hydrogenedentota bacterium]